MHFDYKAQGVWEHRRGEPSVSVDGGITSDIVKINEEVPFILLNKIKE